MRSKKKRTVWTVLIIILLIVASLFLPKYVWRYFYWNFADINDHKKFPRLEVANDPAHITQLKIASSNFQFSVPESFTTKKEYEKFEDFLLLNDAVAFLVLKNDSIIYENYFENFSKTSIIPSFSVSKAFVSALVGIAIDEGYIYSTNQSITFFLKELNKEFDNITIEDLLNMRSGIQFEEGYSNPFAEMPKYYYGTNLLHYIKKLKIEEEPDLHYNYISVNTLLVGQIVERATNTKLSKYLEQKIWKPMGMESSASWSIDSKKDKTVKAFCCINAVARDFARFGLLYLNDGKWNGKQIVPAEWVKRSTRIINDSRDSQGYPYTYQWRVIENGAFFAKGILGQYILVFPAKDLVFVRLGKSVADIDWADLFVKLSEQIPQEQSVLLGE
ncbi:MAG: beta-lactamase family protein [Bacteroidetes bacterium]|nr:beta-lactamase family protein [Bacteroidota bacterium]